VTETARCDSHHHLYPNANAHFAGQQYLVDELARDAASVAEVVSTVYVQAHNAYDRMASPALAPVGETRWVAALPRPDNLISKIVGFADLTLGEEIDAVLDAHVEAGAGRFAGIRHSAAWDADPELPNAGCAPPPGLLRQVRVASAVGAIHRRGFTFETWVYHRQLDEVRHLARQQPDGVIIVDHLGGPIDTGARRDEALSEWRTGLKALAGCPNVLIKLGGLGVTGLTAPGRLSPTPDAGELAAHWGPEIRWCIETFGPQRCLFETNFPVDLRLASYSTLWAAYDLITADLSPAERDWAFRRTAETAYGI
jgi:predicted TIM-barrel fold metal-dependent hydrolase